MATHTLFSTISGLDFTSSPGPRKPITCAQCRLQNALLVVETFHSFTSFAAFEAFLLRPEPWLAAFDFPFGLPLRLLSGSGWPQTWDGYVRLVSAMGKAGFVKHLADYQASRMPGDKLHLRAADLLAGARSPMMMYRVPVGKMFFEGAPRLLASGVSILPCRPTADSRIALEGYPALVARRYIGRASYKSDDRKKQSSDQLVARQRLIDALRSDQLTAVYGLQLDISNQLVTQLIQEPMADNLDALLCAIQAAWSYTQCHRKYGIPPGHDIEGWIVDPGMVVNGGLAE